MSRRLVGPDLTEDRTGDGPVDAAGSVEDVELSHEVGLPGRTQWPRDGGMSNARQRWPLVLAGVAAIATSAGYAMLIRDQETTALSDPVPVFVMSYLTVLSVAALVGAASSGWLGTVGASAATGGLFTMGILGIFSIGLPLLVAASFAAWGLARTRRSSSDSAWRDAGVGLGAAALALILLILP